ncbi:translation initiation factor IF-2 [candidate division MSBL1 archaeon SCGC-AAA259I09]|uniref:Probable translation initiation factor IF-2 n=2 Tax=candidate division MSBL1 TaxID=215777 RepID=A0A133UUY9_9EURY|nr:translation initiation factor IF-2 [candidate division MSBL1 archaeon SCGC-AAA259D14]KXA98024.1 translation initiation factor IF-2 [candidate division MSBL1 archaeon SCGC-AAA259I09]
MSETIRQPIISVLGHVDHGKTLLLDKIRGTTVASREAGAITQHIGATEIPVSTVEGICGRFLERFAGGEVKLPGLLFIDTPGHEAFANLRSRGGALADLGILVIDITEGFKPQTHESIEYLKQNQTPFVIAANKCDLIPGWRPEENACFLDTFPNQNSRVQKVLDEKIYDIVGKLDEYGFQSERFDRIEQFKKQIGIVPTSAKTGEGIPELLAILAGLAQSYMKKDLSVEVTGPARGTVLEIKKERGLGKTIDALIYDGTLSTKDKIAVGGLEKVIITNVRALLRPKPLEEIRDPQEKFKNVDKVSAAAGVKIAAQNLDEAIAGAPIWGIESDEDIDKICKIVKERLESIRIETDKNGIVVKADTLGSLEALESQLRAHEIPIRHADIGEVTRQNIIEAGAVAEDNPLLGVVLAFNVKILPHAKEKAEEQKVKVLQNDVIYRLIEDYEEWVEEEKERIRREKLKGLIRAGKVSIKPGYVFRSSKPAIVGVDVLGGIIRPDFPLMKKDGESVGTVREIQSKQETLSEAESGEEVALSIEGPTVGRQIKEGDVLYVDIPSEQMAKLKEVSEMLSEDEKGVMEEIKSIKKKKDSAYGVM